MNSIARAILRWVTQHLPEHRREYGQAMQAELEELHGWAALEWALGGIIFLFSTQGGRMKTALYWLGVLLIAGVAGWLYTPERWVWSLVILGFGVIVFAYLRPKQAVPVALMFALSIPIGHVISVYVAASRLMQALGVQSANVNITENRTGQIKLVQLRLPTATPNQFDSWFDSSMTTLSNIPSSERLLMFSGLMILVTLLVAFTIAALKNRFTRAAPQTQP